MGRGKEKAEIARLAAKASDKVEAEEEAIVTDKVYTAKRAAEDSATEIIAKAEAERAKREREEAEARAKAEAEIKEKAEKMRKAREAKAKAEAETAERERSCDKAQDKDNYLPFP